MLQVEWALVRKLVSSSRSGVQKWFGKTLKQAKAIGLDTLIHVGLKVGPRF